MRTFVKSTFARIAIAIRNCTTLIAAGAIAFACSDASGPSGPAPVATVAVSAPAQTMVSLGETIQLAAALKDAGGATLSARTVSWSSSNSAFVSIDANSGLATAVANGNVTITAESEGKSGSVPLTVDQHVASVQITAPADTIRAWSDTLRFTATPRDARNNLVAGNHSTAWNSTNTSVATIDAQGIATSVTDGAFTVEATINEIKGTRQAAVKQRGSSIRIVTEPSGARAGVVLQVQPALEVIDAKGNRVVSDNSAIITATIESGGGTLTGSGLVTVNAGTAAFANIAIEGLKGARVLRFSASSLAAALSQSFNVDAGNPALLELIGGGGQTGLANTPLPVAFAARLRDAFQNGIAQTAVSWQVVSGGGQLAQQSTTTDASGVASVQFTLGLFAGEARVRASLPASGLTPVDFVVQATPNATISGTITLTTTLLSAPSLIAALSRQSGQVAQSAQPKRVTGMTFTAPAESFGSKARITRLSVANSQQGAGQRQGSNVIESVPGELIVIFRNAALGVPAAGAAAYRTQSMAAQTATAMRSSLANLESSGRVRIRGVSPVILSARVEVANVADTASVAATLRADARVLAVERNGILHSHTGGIDSRLLSYNGAVPNDPFYPYQAWNYNSIHMPEAWELTTGSSNVIVAVVDDGIRFDHPAVAPNLTNDGFDFVSAGTLPMCFGGTISRTGDGDGIDANPTVPLKVSFSSSLGCVIGTETIHGHGLHVAGTIGAVGNDGSSVTGIAWNVRIRPVRVLDVSGGGTNFDIAQGILYAAGLPADNGSGGIVPPPAQGAHVINLSLGGPGQSLVLENAVIAATNAGSLVIASAGNAATSAPSFPAAYPQVLSVSAVGPDLQLASYSSFGSTIDITAPGGDMGDGDETYGIASTMWNFQTNTPVEVAIQGTSMAAPHVAGVAALIFAANPGITAAQVRARLTNFATDIGLPGNDSFYGAGLLNARAALTQTFAPTRTTRVRLLNAVSGEVVRTMQATGGSFSLGQLADGQYKVFAGEEEGGDGRTGVPLRRWGALGGSAVPQLITVSGAAIYAANFGVGFPSELEPNSSALLADELQIDGYMVGTISAALTDNDFFRIIVPAPGTYVFETIGVEGACGFALDSDTRMTLFSESGLQLSSNDDLSFSSSLLCSRISITLQAGKYALRITGWNTGNYIVMARRG